MHLRGSFVALVTPFDRRGRLDRKTLENLVEWHISEGTQGIVCSATTGEGPTLSDLERKKVAETCIRTSSGRVPVIVATGINDTRTSIRYTEMAQKLGASACMAVTPYYNKPTQRGCILHFQEIAKVGLPTVIYHNPPRTAVRLTAETIAEIAQIPNVVAIKESSHDLELIQKIAKFIPVFSGDDDIAYQILQAGGVGSISTIANILPHGWKQMIQFCLQKKWENGKILFDKFIPLINAVFLETNPQGTKFALSFIKRCPPCLRLPLILPTNSTQKAIKEELISLSLPQFKKVKIVSN